MEDADIKITDVLIAVGFAGSKESVSSGKSGDNVAKEALVVASLNEAVVGNDSAIALVFSNKGDSTATSELIMYETVE